MTMEGAHVFDRVAATPAEIAASRPGDDLVPVADVVMDRAFTLDAPPAAVWPWMVQLGKRRAGWYFTRTVERVIPPAHRAVRSIDARWQALAVGDVIPDWGGSGASFTVARLDAPTTLVYRSERGRTTFSWAITLTPLGDATRTRVFLRLRMAPVRHRHVAQRVGGAFDLLTIVGLADGLRERLAEQR